jgi:hypothetical protein
MLEDGDITKEFLIEGSNDPSQTVCRQDFTRKTEHNLFATLLQKLLFRLKFFGLIPSDFSMELLDKIRKLNLYNREVFIYKWAARA